MDMIIQADLGDCDGYGNCVLQAPGYFDLDDDGLVRILREQVREEDREAVERAVASCPAGALRLAGA